MAPPIKRPYRGRYSLAFHTRLLRFVTVHRVADGEVTLWKGGDTSWVFDATGSCEPSTRQVVERHAARRNRREVALDPCLDPAAVVQLHRGAHGFGVVAGVDDEVVDLAGDGEALEPGQRRPRVRAVEPADRQDRVTGGQLVAGSADRPDRGRHPGVGTGAVLQLVDHRLLGLACVRQVAATVLPGRLPWRRPGRRIGPPDAPTERRPVTHERGRRPPGWQGAGVAAVNCGERVGKRPAEL